MVLKDLGGIKMARTLYLEKILYKFYNKNTRFYDVVVITTFVCYIQTLSVSPNGMDEILQCFFVFVFLFKGYKGIST